MRGLDGQTGSMFSYVDLEEGVPAGHPLRKIRELVNYADIARQLLAAILAHKDVAPLLYPQL